MDRTRKPHFAPLSPPGSALLGATLLFVLVSPQIAVAQGTPQPPAAKVEKLAPITKSDIVSMIHQANQLEIDMGQLAMKKGTRPDIKEYGRRLVRDHQAADKKIRALAQEKQIELHPIPMSVAQREMQSQLNALSGPEFDAAFTEAMSKAHNDSINALSTALNRVGPSETRTLALKLIPLLEQHQELAQNLHKRVTQ